MPPKSTHSQKTKRGSLGGSAKYPPKPASAQKSDIKGFFQQPQDQQNSSILTELNFSSPAGEVEHGTSISPSEHTQHLMMDMEGAEGGPMWNLQTYIKALPTREDMDKYIHRLESSYKSEIQTLKTSLTDTQNKIMDMDTKIVNLDQKMILLEEKKIEHDRYLSYIINITDNLENRSRRNNIRVRGLPETVNVENLRKTLQNIFNSLLERPGETEIEIDRVHRIQGPKVNDSGKPRDVICRIHFFQVKEKIMIAARRHRDFEYEGAQIIFLQDLSKYTLIRRKAVKPLLDVLREREILFRWGFPFQVIVHQGGRRVIFQDINDLPEFSRLLQLPLIHLPDWPHSYQGLDWRQYRGR